MEHKNATKLYQTTIIKFYDIPSKLKIQKFYKLKVKNNLTERLCLSCSWALKYMNSKNYFFFSFCSWQMWISSNNSISWCKNNQTMKINFWCLIYNKDTNKQSSAPLFLIHFLEFLYSSFIFSRTQYLSFHCIASTWKSGLFIWVVSESFENLAPVGQILEVLV